MSEERHVSPARHELGQLRTPLTEGEAATFELLDRVLPADWEIYVQPHLNGCRPDFVLLSASRGVGVVEVKDWSSVEEATLRGALEKLKLYAEEIEDLYCPTLNGRAGSMVGGVSARLILPNVSREKIRLIAPQLSTRRVACMEEFDDVRNIVPGAFAASATSADTAVEDIRSWLEEPRCAREQRYPLFKELNVRQRTLVGEGPGSSGQRRIKGSAGAGKSLVLAARTAHLAKYEGKFGLVTSFNMTLLHYLRDLAVRYPVPERNSLVNEFVTWLHFHGWCKRVCVEAGLSDDYKALWIDKDKREQVLNSELPALARRALEICNPQYDFILVDEGQDWQLDWWKTLQAALKPGGEMMLVADRTQDLYGNRNKWTDEAMVGAGFRGAWTSLDISYRLPASVLPKLRSFATEYIKTDIHLPEPDPQIELQSCTIEWRNVARGEEPAQCAAAVARLHGGDVIAEQRVSPPDIILLMHNRSIGSKCVAELNQRGYNVCHTFSADSRAAKRLKQAFFRGDARVKATTYNSFKGFENSIVVVVITSASHERDLRGIYAALTRVKRDPGGSALIVVNSADELREYGSSWSLEYPAVSE